VQALPSSQELIQRLVLAEFKQNVDVLSIFEEVLEAYDVVVVETPVNFDLGHQLLLGSRLCKRRFGYHFGGRDTLSLKVCELIALCEASFAEEFASEILLDADITVELDDLFLNNDLGVLLLVVGRWLGCLWLLGLHKALASIYNYKKQN
jgi:hypothetical protein